MANIIGKVLLEQFRVDAFIASGGMGAVYRVWDLKRNVPLAMKILNADLAEDEHIFKLFEREARALKKLAHPNIVSFYGLFRSSDFAFLLEQYVDGPSLSDVLKQNRGHSLDFTQAAVYLKAIASALGYAHANGVVHCDVKPGNVLVDRGGGVFLTDFGIARHADSTTTTLGTMGTAAYMAPEQIRGEPVSAATDVYALGVLIFEMFTGRRPFSGVEVKEEESGPTSNERIRAAHLRVPAPDACAVNPNVPAALAAVIQKAMSKSREARYQSANELLAAVCSALNINPDSIPTRAEPPADLYGQAVPRKSPKRQKPFLAIGVGLSAVIVILAGILIFGAGKQATSPTPQLHRPVIAHTNTPRRSYPTEEPTEVIWPTDTSEPVFEPTDTDEPPSDTFFCPGAPHQDRFKVYQSIYICTQEDPLALRVEPGGDRIKWLSTGADLTITGGPRCADDVVWWQVETELGYSGWVMDGSDSTDEYYLCSTQ